MMHLFSTFNRSRSSVLIALILIAIGGACSSTSSSKATPGSGATTTAPTAATTTAPSGGGAKVDVTATGALKFHLKGTTANCETRPGFAGHTNISITLDKTSYPQVGTVLQMDNEIIKWSGPNGSSYGGSAAPGSFKQHPISVKLTQVKMLGNHGTVTLNGSVVCAA